MRPKKERVERIALIPPEPDPKRHKKMLDGAAGVMFYSSAHLAGYPTEPSSKIKVEQKGKGMFSKEVCDYLGCSRRHLYWLIRNRSLPYFVFRSGPFPQYVFRLRDVDNWLKTYRGKGRELGIRKMRLNGTGKTSKKEG